MHGFSDFPMLQPFGVFLYNSQLSQDETKILVRYFTNWATLIANIEYYFCTFYLSAIITRTYQEMFKTTLDLNRNNKPLNIIWVFFFLDTSYAYFIDAYIPSVVEWSTYLHCTIYNHLWRTIWDMTMKRALSLLQGTLLPPHAWNIINCQLL